jgi:(p)ppGpp synthase/HD superfamily hydrolase
MIELALRIALEAHQGQTDKGGNPYVLHPIRVMNSMSSDITRVVALLHDVIEDTKYTEKKLLEFGVHKIAIGYVKTLTHNHFMDYLDEYIYDISFCKICTEVKKADLIDNMKILRLKDITKTDIKRLKKYKNAYNYLNNV